MRTIPPLKIGISGVRGIVGSTFTPETAVHFTRAFATLVQRGSVAVARDTRPSGEIYAHAVFSGLIFSGLPLIDTQILPTPTLQVYVKEKRLAGGIMITASHNTEEWNGLKFICNDGTFLSPHTAQNLIDIYHQGVFIESTANEFRSPLREDEAFAIHFKKILPVVNPGLIRKRRARVLADPGGGVGSRFDRMFLESLGCDVEVMHEHSGTGFSRPPEPVPENLAQAAAQVVSGGFDLGFAQDPDGDRLCLIDEQGKILGGELTLAFALKSYLSQGRKGIVAINLSTSSSVECVAAETGSRVVRTPVGEINVVEAILREGAIAGGEGNGGVIIPQVHSCRDSFTAMALVLDLLGRDSRPVSVIASEIPRFHMINKKIPCSMSNARRIITLLHEEYPHSDTRDGLRVDLERCWFHIRTSNTEPVIRLVAEGPKTEVEELAAGLYAKISILEEP